MAGRLDLELTVRALGVLDTPGLQQGRRECAGDTNAGGTSGSQTQAQALPRAPLQVRPGLVGIGALLSG